MKEELKEGIDDYYKKIDSMIIKSQNNVIRKINYEMIDLYYNIGKEINELINKYYLDYSQNSIIKEFSEKLTSKYGNGYSVSNIKAMKKFYLVYKSTGHTLCDQLSWSHNRLIMNIENEEKRIFYLKESIRSFWSVRQLERQINSFYYERIISNNELYEESIKSDRNDKIIDFIKDPYVLEFLDIKDNNYLEKDLETNILEHIQEFLLELGRGFSFVSRQKRIDVEGDNYYIDLVFYNYSLKFFLLIDLKLGKLTHQDIGQMDFYIRYYDNEVKKNDDNPTIGIILCSSKKDTIVKYSIINDRKNLFASKYQFYLPTEEEFAKEVEKEKNSYDNNR